MLQLPHTLSISIPIKGLYELRCDGEEILTGSVQEIETYLFDVLDITIEHALESGWELTHQCQKKVVTIANPDAPLPPAPEFPVAPLLAPPPPPPLP